MKKEVEDLPKSRADAKKAGAPKYYTGIPCTNGHLSFRHTSFGQCGACLYEKGRARRPLTDLQTKENQKKVREARRKAREGPCTDCKDTYPWYMMEFDHRDGRNSEYRGLNNIRSITRLLAELEKCDRVCANCHRARTYFRALAAGSRTY